MTAWRTRIDPEHTAAFGEPELHAAAFQHKNDPGGTSHVVALQIPETPGALFVQAMAKANDLKARVLFICDTGEQAEDAAARASKLLPRHCRVAYERVVAGAWGAAGQ